MKQTLVALFMIFAASFAVYAPLSMEGVHAIPAHIGQLRTAGSESSVPEAAAHPATPPPQHMHQMSDSAIEGLARMKYYADEIARRKAEAAAKAAGATAPPAAAP